MSDAERLLIIAMTASTASDLECAVGDGDENQVLELRANLICGAFSLSLKPLSLGTLHIPKDPLFVTFHLPRSPANV